ncbi:MAG: geranylgeranylglycerol-phosphate geranylgeranyltransferase [Candidatus Heimdallarchaeota archaeon]|nr:geranylgeranylglycerol-phosphate geranylgeranyltransferase [Candidatus Heimdallarchaeota archaeon]MCK4289954.1 geranylgeranylglycerol-phosphate geranylgeranyltransferase [Candidatus Heimdallarchaeota archaeon]
MTNPWIRIMRPFNCFLLTMCAIVGIMVSNPEEFYSVSDLLGHLPTLVMIFIGGWALSASAMVLNDYFDIEVDKINDPKRPIPSGEITPKQALTFGIILIAVGILMGIGIDLFENIRHGSQFGVSIVTAVICAIMAAAYTKYMKRFSIVGNMAVSIGVWMGFLYGDLVFDFMPEVLPQCMGAAAFFLNFGREVSKGIMDIEGDRENKVTTVATALGSKWTAIIASAIIFLAIPVSIIPIFVAGASWVYLFSINVIQALVLAVSIWLLIDHKPATIKKIKYVVLVTMLLALIAFSLEAFLGGYVVDSIIPVV